MESVSDTWCGLPSTFFVGSFYLGYRIGSYSEFDPVPVCPEICWHRGRNEASDRLNRRNFWCGRSDKLRFQSTVAEYKLLIELDIYGWADLKEICR